MASAEPTPPPPKKDKSPMVQYGEYSYLALVLPVGALAGWFLGGWLDGKFHTHWIQWVGGVIGIVGGFWDLLRAVKKMNREN